MGGRALNGLGALPGYRIQSNSEYPSRRLRGSDGGVESSSSKGKEPRPTAKVPK